MSNLYYSATALSRFTKARAEAVTAQLEAIEAGFDLLPEPTAFNAGKLTYAAETGSGNSYVAAMPNTLLSYVEGQEVVLKLSHANTGAATLNIDGLGARAIKLADGSDPSADDLQDGQIAVFRYDGTAFQLLSAYRGNILAAAESAAEAAVSAATAEASRVLAGAAAASALNSQNNAAASAAAAAATAAGISDDLTGYAELAGATFTGPVIINGGSVKLVRLADIDISSTNAGVLEDIPSGFDGIEVTFYNYRPSIDLEVLAVQVGTAGSGGAFLGSNVYIDQRTISSGATATPSAVTSFAWGLTPSIKNTDVAYRGFGKFWLTGFNTTSGTIRGGGRFGGAGTSLALTAIERTFVLNSTGVFNAIKIASASGSIENLKMQIDGILK